MIPSTNCGNDSSNPIKDEMSIVTKTSVASGVIIQFVCRYSRRRSSRVRLDNILCLGGAFV